MPAAASVLLVAMQEILGMIPQRVATAAAVVTENAPECYPITIPVEWPGASGRTSQQHGMVALVATGDMGRRLHRPPEMPDKVAMVVREGMHQSADFSVPPTPVMFFFVLLSLFLSLLTVGRVARLDHLEPQATRIMAISMRLPMEVSPEPVAMPALLPARPTLEI